METTLSIQAWEYEQRKLSIINTLQERKLSGAVCFDRDYILYYSGFAFIPTERPIAFVLGANGQSGLFVPRLELEHAQSIGAIDQVVSYEEYPYLASPMESLADMLTEFEISDSIGADQNGYPWVFGYQGPTLSEVSGSRIIDIRKSIEEQMMVKSAAEVVLIRESVKWGNLAHHLLQKYTQPGKTETEASQRASDEATQAMLGAIGPIYRAQGYFAGGASAGYRGQIGRNSAIPHALANNITFLPGDVLVSGAGASVWGYQSELERTMIIGNPTSEQKKMFDHMIALQGLAFEVMGPGVRCSRVDEMSIQYYQDHDLVHNRKHHVGHAIGIRYHEAPFLDIGDHRTMEPGMVFTVEPGLYSPDLGGFRHSDTVLITPDGIEILTYYPRDLESLTIQL